MNHECVCYINVSYVHNLLIFQIKIIKYNAFYYERLSITERDNLLLSLENIQVDTVCHFHRVLLRQRVNFIKQFHAPMINLLLLKQFYVIGEMPSNII